MFIAGSISSSAIWGYANDYVRLHNDETAILHDFNYSGHTTGDLGHATLAPDGLIYVPPSGNFKTDGVTAVNEIIVIDPGNSNDGAKKWSRAKAFRVAATGSATRPNIPLTQSVTVPRDRYPTKGILADNGKIYFIPGNIKYMMVLTPTGLDSGTGLPTATWEFVDMATTFCYSSVTGALTTSKATDTVVSGEPSGLNYMGGVLGTDGWIYLVPYASTKLVRFAPRSTSTWTNPLNSSTTSERFEVGYWDGLTNATRINFGTGYYNTLPNNSGTTAKKFSGGICFDSSTIYLTPAESNYIFKIVLSAWGTSSEFVTNTTNGLNLTLVPGFTVTTGTGNQGFKFSQVVRTAFDMDDNSLYYIYQGRGTGGYTDSNLWHILRMYVGGGNESMSVLDPQLVPSASSSSFGVAMMGALLPNGEIKALSVLNEAYGSLSKYKGWSINTTPGAYNNEGLFTETPIVVRQTSSGYGYVNKLDSPSGYLVTGFGNTSKPIVIPPTPADYSQAIAGGLNENNVFEYRVPGKVIIVPRSNMYGVEILSVKGYYTGVTRFGFLDNFSMQYMMPAWLPYGSTNIKNSKYNLYNNS